jgi:hypothetical protein
VRPSRPKAAAKTSPVRATALIIDAPKCEDQSPLPYTTTASNDSQGAKVTAAVRPYGKDAVRIAYGKLSGATPVGRASLFRIIDGKDLWRSRFALRNAPSFVGDRRASGRFGTDPRWHYLAPPDSLRSADRRDSNKR